jgi:membrane protease YdiL (CAAX protease family)
VAWLRRQLRRVSIDTWRAIDADGRPPDAGGFDAGILVVLLATAFALTFAWYLGQPEFYMRHFRFSAGTDEPAWILRGYLFWAAVIAVPCLVVPVILRACVPGLDVRAHLRAAGRLLADLRFWIAMIVAVVPALGWGPRIAPVGGSHWAIFGVAYAVQLAALIILLFGYVVSTLRPRFGGHAVYVALIPFAMFHYGRPDGEVIGALAAAIVLVIGDAIRPLGGEARGPAIDRRTVAVLLLVAISLTAQEYLGDRSIFDKVLPPSTAMHEWYALYGFAWWAGWRVLGYLVFPALVILLIPGVRVRDQHLSVRGTIKHLWVYAALFAAVLPAVWAASHFGSFQETYPFYKWANRSSKDLWSWEAMYAAQFLSLEFFFRGVMLQCLRKVAGSNAIFVMIVPYCMIHYGKPMPETLGAIGAGLILGTLAMRTRSIWGGVMIHVGVAITMDVLALGYCPPPGHGPCGGAQ